MRFHAAAVISTALIAGAAAHGDHGAQQVIKDAEAAASASAKGVVDSATDSAKSAASAVSSAASADLPTFTVSSRQA